MYTSLHLALGRSCEGYQGSYFQAVAVDKEIDETHPDYENYLTEHRVECGSGQDTRL